MKIILGIDVGYYHTTKRGCARQKRIDLVFEKDAGGHWRAQSGSFYYWLCGSVSIGVTDFSKFSMKRKHGKTGLWERVSMEDMWVQVLFGEEGRI